MSLRTRVMLALVALTAIAAAILGWFSYSSTRSQLDRQTDQSLSEAATYVIQNHGPDGGHGNDPHNSVDLQVVAAQELDNSGAIEHAATGLTVPVTAADVAIATGRTHTRSYRTTTIGSTSYRMLTVPEDQGGAFQLLRPLTDQNAVLSSLRSRILAAAVAVTVAGAVCGWLLAAHLTRRLRILAAAAQTVARTGRLDVQMPTAGSDETGHVANAFQHMLTSLRQAQQAQRQLVQDAGHELRTPLTSLQTNLDILERYPQLARTHRDGVLADLRSETRELTHLLNELISLSLGELDHNQPRRSVRLDHVAEHAVIRARRRFGRTITIDAEPNLVQGRPAELDRAIANLLENAVKFSPDSSPIDVTVHAGQVVVGDHGTGIDESDLPRIFDRFYRSSDARALPGSGLGLAIVEDIVRRTGGTVLAANRPERGALIGFQLPATTEE